MRILRNYILKELSYPLAVSTFTLTFIFILGNVVKIAELILNNRVPFLELMKFLGLIIPELLTFTLPTGLLASILLVFGELTQNNEITAIRASGVSLRGIMLPVIVLSFFLSFFVLLISDQVVPQYSYESRVVLKKLFLKDPFAHMKAGVPAKLKNDFVIVAREVAKDKLRNVTIYQTQPEKPTRTIIAERCEIFHDANKVKVKLFNGTIDEPDEEQTNVFHKLDFESYELPLVDLENIGHIERKTRENPIDALINMSRESGRDEGEKQRLQIEIHKKISFSLGCFIFTLVGMPVAIITRRGNTLVSFGIAIMLLTVYYVFYSWVQALAIQGIVKPQIALWLPSGIFFLVGCGLVKKVLKV